MGKQQSKATITVRKNLDFGLDGDDIPKYWAAGNPFKTRLVDAVQATFPDGERYFIASVRAFRDAIQDPELMAEVKDFMLQEGQHGMVHSQYNERLKRQGIDIEAFTRHTKTIADRRLERLSPEYNVALTAALEHFTAMMADLFFAEKSVLAGADERVRGMLAWHAVEEMEHKAVAFDVMKKVAKVGYLRRTAAMTHATVAFSLYSLIAPWHMLRMDGFSFAQRLNLYAKGLPWLFHPRKGIFMRLLPMIAHYYRQDFHPSDIPNVHNYNDWLQSYAKDGNPLGAGEAMYEAAA